LSSSRRARQPSAARARVARMVIVVGWRHRTPPRSSRRYIYRYRPPLLSMMSVMAERILVHEHNQFPPVSFFSEIDEKNRPGPRRTRWTSRVSPPSSGSFVGRQHLVDQLGRQIKRKALAQQSFALVGKPRGDMRRSQPLQPGRQETARLAATPASG